MAALDATSLATLAEHGFAPEDLEGRTVILRDIRGHCAAGMVEWLDGHGFDYRKFIREGLPAQQVAETNDALGLRAVVACLRRN